ncbi:hypothetical protein [Rufibacter roseus]|uniref:DUF892 family protein n=1 Tax=Rufibacter roseus TaxID=1567108 RepID=A0ABW2DNE7_9BACT|nr:hypothetical protein [Rufibacter roseus]
MSASTYQGFIQQAFVAEQDTVLQKITPLYKDLEKALTEARPGRKSQEEVSFRFERLRLGIGISLMQLLTDLGGDEDSAMVRDLLEDALAAQNVAEIDATIQKKSFLFEELYTDLYVNTEAEEVLALFESTLGASSKEEADSIIASGFELAQNLEFPSQDEDSEE